MHGHDKILSIGNCEEQLSKNTCRSTVSRLWADSWRLMVTVGRLLAICWLTVGRLLADNRPTGFGYAVGQQSAYSIQSVMCR